MLHHKSSKSIYFGVNKSKVKVTRHKKKQVCAGLQTKRNIDACCIRQLRLIFPAADAAADRQIFRAWSLSQRQKHCQHPSGSQHYCDAVF